VVARRAGAVYRGARGDEREAEPEQYTARPPGTDRAGTNRSPGLAIVDLSGRLNDVRKALWILSAVALLTAGCGLSSRVALPTWQSACPTGQLCSALTFPIRGQLRADAGCLWLRFDDGREATIVWPPGYAADPALVTVFDPSGRDVARVGDVIAAGGSVVDAGGSGPRPSWMSSTCGRTLVVEIQEIIAASSP